MTNPRRIVIGSSVRMATQGRSVCTRPPVLIT